MACRERETVGSKCDVCTKALPLRLRDLGRGGNRETVRVRGGGWVSKETESSRHSRSDAHKNSQRLWQDTQNLHILKSNKNPSTERGSRHKVPPLTKRLFAIGNCWERKTLIFQWCIAGTSTTLQDRLHAQAKLANTKQTPCFVLFGLVWFSCVFCFVHLIFSAYWFSL